MDQDKREYLKEYLKNYTPSYRAYKTLWENNKRKEVRLWQIKKHIQQINKLLSQVKEPANLKNGNRNNEKEHEVNNPES